MGSSKANDEYALTSATKDLESKTRKVRSQMSSVKSQIASVTKDIHRINMQIHKAQRRLNTMDRSIPETHAKVIAIRREIKKHEQDKREFEKLLNQFKKSNLKAIIVRPDRFVLASCKAIKNLNSFIKNNMSNLV